jgi:hypothetical protein
MTSLYIKNQLIKILKTFLYENNDARLRQQVINKCTPVMENILSTGGIGSYTLVCDDSNNTDQTGVLVLEVNVGFIYPATTITLRILASDTGEVVETQTL